MKHQEENLSRGELRGVRKLSKETSQCILHTFQKWNYFFLFISQEYFNEKMYLTAMIERCSA